LDVRHSCDITVEEARLHAITTGHHIIKGSVKVNCSTSQQVQRCLCLHLDRQLGPCGGWSGGNGENEHGLHMCLLTGYKRLYCSEIQPCNQPCRVFQLNDQNNSSSSARACIACIIVFTSCHNVVFTKAKVVRGGMMAVSKLYV
jgi:hypothetical protein